MPTFLKKTMVYLGLLDDEYEEYDDRGQARPGHRAPVDAGMAEDDRYATAQVGRIRTLPAQAPSGATSFPSAPVTTRVSPVIRPMSAGDAAKVQVVAPTQFGDAREIADYVKANRPVIVNLQVAERDLQRRMIDFCSGVTYALSGQMEKVADAVFLLTPTNVKVSDEERQRLQERGFGRS